ncbi:Zinc finger, RING-type [Dillenia turbinata]|uniref:RING-type E3 ubiquitin transferase n=1 Tax=Dillenia turbinata TaxID=194707 RepID=A0AAN8UV20_9MAGN
MAAVFKPFPLFIFLLFHFANFKPSSSSQSDTVSTSADNIGAGVADSNIPPPPSLPPPPAEKLNGSPFKPSIAVIIAVLTILFSFTFLLLLYAKHCKRSNAASDSRGALQSAARKNSGVDRTTVESLPVFRFGSLRGQKEGLECAVCITKFEPSEVLRLLPKCKHAFHVECVDTWLDAHSTCPLCRYRVDPEDILLVDETTHLESGSRRASSNKAESFDSELPSFRRVSGRHSSAGERRTGMIQIVVQKSNESSDSVGGNNNNRRSLDSLKNKNSNVLVGCFDRNRKDGLLLNKDKEEEEEQRERERFEHRIIVSGHHQHRWSDVQPSDILYLQSEMIMNGSWPSTWRGGEGQVQLLLNDGGGSRRVGEEEIQTGEEADRTLNSGRHVINGRCVSEITGLSRFPAKGIRGKRDHKQRQAGFVSRWTDWISQSRPPVRSPIPQDDVP